MLSPSMPIVDAEAVVLRHYSLCEADRIIVFATREHGKVRAVAKGVKKPRSRLAGPLEPLTHLRAKFFLREGADLWQLRQCETIRAYLGRNPSPELVNGCSYVAELTCEFLEEHNPNPPLFRLLLSTIAALESRGCDEALVHYFELWLLKIEGVLPDYTYCSNCGGCAKDSGLYAQVDSGQGLCVACCEGRGLQIRPAALDALSAFLRLPPLGFSALELTRPVLSDLGRLTQKLLEWSLEKPLRSYPALVSTWRKAKGGQEEGI